MGRADKLLTLLALSPEMWRKGKGKPPPKKPAKNKAPPPQ
jgi:hypothetical protein